jgi:hypothetical protein
MELRYLAVFCSEVVVWVFGKLLSVKTVPYVDQILGDLIEEQLFPIAQLLDDRMASLLVIDLIRTLTGLFVGMELTMNASSIVFATWLRLLFQI